MTLRDLFVFAVVLGGLPFAFTRPYIGLLLFSWLAYMRPQDLTWGMAKNFRFSYYVAIAMFAGWVFFERRPFLRWSPAIKWVVLLFAWISLSMFLNDMSNPQRQIRRWLDITKVLAVALFVTGQVDSKRRLDLMLFTIALSLGFYGIKGGAWGLLTGGRIQQGPGGMLKDNNDLCLALNMNIPILFYLGMTTASRNLRRVLHTAAVLCGVAVIITGSRGGFLTMGFVTGILVLKSRHKAIGIGVGVVAVLMVFVFLPTDVRQRLGTLKDPEAESSAASRLYAWRVAGRMIRDNPAIGVGFNAFVNHFARYEKAGEKRPGGERAGAHVAHNSYLQVWAESGTPAFLFFMAGMISTILLMRRLRSAMRYRDGPRWFVQYTHMVEVSLCAFLLGGTFLNRAHFDLLYHVIALGGVLYYLAPRILVSEAEDRTRDSPEAPARVETVPSNPFVLGNR